MTKYDRVNNFEENESVQNKAEDGQSVKQDAAVRKFTKRQILTFINLSLAHFFDSCSFSIIAPIYPQEADAKGVGSTVTGLIFGSFSFVMFIASPICGKVLPKVGAKFMFIAGEFVCAGANIMFGLLDKMNTETEFIVFSFVIRIFSAVGAAAAITALSAIITNTFPNNVAQTIALVKVFSGLGYMVGPLIGGALDQAGGYFMPFLVLGVSLLVIVFVNFYFLPNDESKTKKLGSYKEFWRIPAIWFTSCAVFTGALSFGFLDPTLSNHLLDINKTLSPFQIGSIFLLIGLVYALTSPFWGWLADKKNTTRAMIVGGFFSACVSYLLIGPSPIIHLPDKVWVVCVGLGCLGMSIACGVTPAYQDILVSAKWYGMADDMTTYGLISGQYTSAFSIGTFLGPVLGGILVDQLTFAWAVTIFAGLNIALSVIILLFSLWEFRCFKGRRPGPGTTTLVVTEDRKALLDENNAT